MLSEISQRNTNIVWCHSYGESTKKSNTKKEVDDIEIFFRDRIIRTY